MDQGLIFEKLKKFNEEIKHAILGHCEPCAFPGAERPGGRIGVLGSLDALAVIQIWNWKTVTLA